jgi:hypothetical protein
LFVCLFVCLFFFFFFFFVPFQAEPVNYGSGDNSVPFANKVYNTVRSYGSAARFKAHQVYSKAVPETIPGTEKAFPGRERKLVDPMFAGKATFSDFQKTNKMARDNYIRKKIVDNGPVGSSTTLADDTYPMAKRKFDYVSAKSPQHTMKPMEPIRRDMTYNGDFKRQKLKQPPMKSSINVPPPLPDFRPARSKVAPPKPPRPTGGSRLSRFKL